MPIRFEMWAAENAEAAKAFNSRLNRNGDAPFLLPESIAADSHSHELIKLQHYLALEDGDNGADVRGGYLVVEYPSVIDGEAIAVTNIQSPLSESIIDSKYSMMPLQMVKQFLRHNPLCFVVGMGDQSNPLPRLLRAAGWSVETVPFFFRIHRAFQFLTGTPVLRSPWWKHLAAQVAAYSGAGAVGAALLQRASVRPGRELSVQSESDWGNWADEVWEASSAQARFAVQRNLAMLREFYPPDPRLVIHRMLQGTATIGWSASFLTPMKDNPYFGNMRVGTILDCVSKPGFHAQVAALADRALAGAGAELVITNQSLASWKEAFAAAGFRAGPSKFQAALSPALARKLTKTPVADGVAHITRGDGDGRIHL